MCGGFSAARDIADIVHCVSRGTFGDDTEAYAACAGDLVQSEASQMSRTACLAGMFDDGTKLCATCTTGYVQPAVSQTSGTACLAHGVHCVSSGDVRRRHRGGAAGTEGSGSPKHCRRCALRVWRMFDDDTEVRRALCGPQYRRRRALRVWRGRSTTAPRFALQVRGAQYSPRYRGCRAGECSAVCSAVHDGRAQRERLLEDDGDSTTMKDGGGRPHAHVVRRSTRRPVSQRGNHSIWVWCIDVHWEVVAETMAYTRTEFAEPAHPLCIEVHWECWDRNNGLHAN